MPGLQLTIHMADLVLFHARRWIPDFRVGDISHY